jgi:hypothetical protein
MNEHLVRYHVFRDAGGNRFVFPTVYDYDAPDGSCSRVSWEYCRRLCCALSVSEEKFKLLVAPDEEGKLNFPHVVAEAHSRGLAHGGSTVWIIGGPRYDEISP